MGGLVCRAFLQNPELATAEARRAVDKLFTYATPRALEGERGLAFDVPIAQTVRPGLRGTLRVEVRPWS